MKKIIGILLAGALVTSAFAADVSARVQVDGLLFNYGDGVTDGGAGKGFTDGVTALTIGHKSQPWNPDLSISINGDRAGASASFVTNGGDNVFNTSFGIQSQKYSIWFKPFDMLKVTVGHYATDMNQEKIDWTHTESGIESQGYALDLNVEGFFATAFFAPGWGKSWFSMPKGGDVALEDIYVKAGYSADFGRIQAMFHMIDLKNIWAGAGYNNTFGSVSMFVNALVGFNTDGGLTVRGEGFVSTNIDAFGISAFVAGGYVGEGDVNRGSQWKIGSNGYGKPVGARLGASVKATYAFEGFTPYIYFIAKDFLATNIDMHIKPGVTGSLGSMGWEVACDIALNSDDYKTQISVPVQFNINF